MALAVPMPRYFGNAEDRCDEACLATQYTAIDGRVRANDAVAMLMHLVVDPDCAHCAQYPSRATPESAWHLLDTIVTAARNAGPRK